jgi:hypothetical protein
LNKNIWADSVSESGKHLPNLDQLINRCNP